MAIITLLTDFGQESFFPAAMKGVILGLCPEATIVDITHAVAEHDILAGGFALYATYRYFPPGTIHCAVVDPGVGSERAIVAAEMHGHIFLAPDNGLLSFLLKLATPDRLFSVENRQYWNKEVSPTFHGRDIFAPLAARLACGLPLEKVGPPRQTLMRLAISSPEVTAGGIIGEIVSVDRFGNLVTNIQEELLPPEAEERARASVRISGRTITGIRKTYADVALGQLVVYVGSTGLVEIGRNRGSARDVLGAGVGHRLKISCEE